jgi:hypothetical protein
MAKAGRKARPARLRKVEQVRVLVTANEKRALEAAAERAGLPVATWLRTVGLREAQKGGAAGYRNAVPRRTEG